MVIPLTRHKNIGSAGSKAVSVYLFPKDIVRSIILIFIASQLMC